MTPRQPLRLFIGTCAALLGSFLLSGYGVTAGKLLLPRAASDICVAHPVGHPILVDDFFPLSNRCHSKDGTSTDLVPSFVNPLFFVLLGIAAILLVLVVSGIVDRFTSIDRQRGDRPA